MQLLQKQYSLDAETATELLRQVGKEMRAVLQGATSALSLRGLDPSEAPRVLTADHIKFATSKRVPSLGPASFMPAYIQADGDGNCLLTTLALDMEMKVRQRQKCSRQSPFL